MPNMQAGTSIWTSLAHYACARARKACFEIILTVYDPAGQLDNC